MSRGGSFAVLLLAVMALPFIYSIKYDDEVQVRTMMPPPSAVRAGLTAAELQGLRDRGLPGYRAKLSDIRGAWYVTIYLETLVSGQNGTVRKIPLSPALCMVHHNYGDRGRIGGERSSGRAG